LEEGLKTTYKWIEAQVKEQLSNQKYSVGGA
jgi:hypothetical protein